MDRALNGVPVRRGASPVAEQQVALVDLLDRLLAGGVVITGDITISIAGVDLVRISLRALVASIRPEMARALDVAGEESYLDVATEEPPPLDVSGPPTLGREEPP